MPLNDLEILESTQENSQLFSSIVYGVAVVLFIHWILKYYVARPRYNARPTKAKVWTSRPNNSATNKPVKENFIRQQAMALGQAVTPAMIAAGAEMMKKSDAHIQGRGSGTMQDRHFVSASWLREAAHKLVTEPTIGAHNEFVNLLGIINPVLVAQWQTIYTRVDTIAKKSWNMKVTAKEMRQFINDLQNSHLNRAIWDTGANQEAGNKLDISVQTALQHAPGHALSIGRAFFSTSNALGFRPRVERGYIVDDITRGTTRSWQVDPRDVSIDPREILEDQTRLISYIRSRIDKLYNKE